VRGEGLRGTNLGYSLYMLEVLGLARTFGKAVLAEVAASKRVAREGSDAEVEIAVLGVVIEPAVV